MLSNLIKYKLNFSGTSKNAPVSASTGLAALQSMAGLSGASSKDSLNALFAQAAQAEQQQAILKQQQKLLQQLPNNAHRKTYEAMFAEIKQAADLRFVKS